MTYLIREKHQVLAAFVIARESSVDPALVEWRVNRSWMASRARAKALLSP